MKLNTTGTGNTALGGKALEANTTANANTAIGYLCLDANTTGASNAGVGKECLTANTTGGGNAALGKDALKANTTGGSNTGIGFDAGDSITTGSGNTILGAYSDTASDADHAIAIGYDVTGTSSTTTIGSGTSDIRTSHGSTSWATVSDERVKKDIKDAEAGLSFINDLRPVTFNYKAKGDLPEEFTGYEKNSTEPYKFATTNHGFIAQEVKETIDNHPEIKDGFDMWDVRETGQQEVAPTAVIPMMVKAVQELSNKIDELQQDSHPPKCIEEMEGYETLINRIKELENK
tara:strand:- start:42 stop:911 length:870 start_codon:yes stop_codon:yes gene_type:complete